MTPLICGFLERNDTNKLIYKTEKKKTLSSPKEISITSDMQMTPPLWQKVKRN